MESNTRKNILFLTLVDFESVKERGIYTDLLREFVRRGNKIYAISPVERRKNAKTHVIEEKDCKILKLCIGNTQKTNSLEKGISTIAIELQFLLAIRKYFCNVKFHLILYTTPPITFCKPIRYVKKRDGASSYLMLKDIFPQNAVDIGILDKTGAKGVLYRHFRMKERALYSISDRIGCMSAANAGYLLKHNPALSKDKVEVCPNSIEPMDMSVSLEEKEKIRKKYGLPEDRTIFIYGGNLGKPQGIGFMLKCLHSQRGNGKVFFLIVGNGTEYIRIEKYVDRYRPENMALHRWIPKEDYDRVVAACDVGMVFLDHRFTVPNFPSRVLGYMGAKIPVLAVTDQNTDIGSMIVENGFGWWCKNGDVREFANTISKIMKNSEELPGQGMLAYQYLKGTFDVRHACDLICNFGG